MSANKFKTDKHARRIIGYVNVLFLTLLKDAFYIDDASLCYCLVIMEELYTFLKSKQSNTLYRKALFLKPKKKTASKTVAVRVIWLMSCSFLPTISLYTL